MKIKFKKLRKVGLRYLNVLMLSLLLVVQSVPSSVLISQAYAQEATPSNTTTATTTSSPASTPNTPPSGNVGVGETTPPVDSGTPTITPPANQNSATPSGQPAPTDTNNQTPPPVSEPQSPATPEASIQNQSNTSAPTSDSPANANAPSSTVNNSNPTPSPNSQTPPPTPPDDNKASLAAVVVKSGESNLGAILGAFSTSSAAESATLTTNKPDYSPTDTVLISGTGFKANHGYTLEVTSQDPPPVDFKTDITTKSDGTFVYSYQLDGNYRPNYKIEVKLNGSTVATTTFTDTQDKVAICHGTGSNGNPYVGANADKTADAGGHDGHSGPIWFPGITVTWGDIIPPFDYSGGHYSGKNWTAQGQAILNNECSVNGAMIVKKVMVGGTDSFAFTGDVSGTINTNNGTKSTNDVTPGTYTSVESAKSGWDLTSITCDDGQSANVSTGNTGTRTATFKVDAGETVTCTFTNTKQQGTITVNKVLTQGDSGKFNLQIDSSTAGTGGNVGNGGTTGAVSVSASGTHAVGETGSNTSLSNYSTTYSCVDGQSTVVSGSGATSSSFSVPAGHSIVCTFTNTRKQGRITFQKVVNDQSDVSAWTFTIGGGNGTAKSGDTKTYNTSSYSVTESGPDGYSLTGASGACSLIEGAVTLSVSDQGGTCTITNTRNQGTIELKKAWSGTAGQTTLNIGTSNGGSQVDTQLTGINGTAPLTTGANSVNPGTYYVSETGGLDNYNSSLVCTDNEQPLTPGESNSVIVASGHAVICTFTNTRKQGRVTFQKLVDDQSDVSGWTFTVNDHVYHSGDSATFDTGTYTVTESGSGDYTLFSVGGICTGLDDGNSATLTVTQNGGTCTFTNHVKRGTVIVTKYQDDNGNGKFDKGEQPLSDWDMTLGETTQTTDEDGSTTFENLLPGTQTLSETPQEGWNLSNIYCNNEDWQLDTSNEHTVNIPAGGTINCYVGNYQDAHITVIKDVVKPNGDPVTDTSTNFDFHIRQNGGDVVDPFQLTDGQSQSFDLTPGSYDVNEVLNQNNYDFDGCEAVYSNQSVGITEEGGVKVDINSGDTVTVTCTNKQKPGTVLGYKWNDLNGNGQFDKGEAKLSGWTIFADLNSNGTLDQGEPSTTTDNNGNYSLSLNPGSYRICEVGQNGWQQTYPINGNNNCHSVTLSSNETFDGSLNFGNQGHGKITVKKNVDTNGDGKVDILGATDWTYRIGEAGPYTTGSTQDVTAGSYTISEGSKDNYHLVSWSCNNEQSGETNAIRLNVNAGDNITCTFFNSHNTGDLKAQKVVDDQSALSAWSFSLDGGAAVAANNSGLVDFGQVTTGDTHTITESGPNGYQLVSITGTNCSQSGSAAKATVNQGSTTTCTFSNQAVKGSVSLQKITDPASDGTKFNFGLTLGATTVGSTSLSGKDSPFTFNNLKAGDYSITETGISDWDLTAVSCNVGVVQNGNTVTFSLAAAGNVSCSFTNKAKRGKITVNKQTNPSGDNTQFFIDLTGSGTITGGGAGSISSNSSKDYEVTAGTYTVNETIPSGWTQTGNGCVNLVVAPGQSVSCTITNSRAAGVVLAASTGKILAATGAPTLWLFISTGLTALGAALMIAGKKLRRRK